MCAYTKSCCDVTANNTSFSSCPVSVSIHTRALSDQAVLLSTSFKDSEYSVYLCHRFFLHQRRHSLFKKNKYYYLVVARRKR